MEPRACRSLSLRDGEYSSCILELELGSSYFGDVSFLNVAGSHPANVGVAHSSRMGLIQTDLEATGYESEVRATWARRARCAPVVLML